MNFSVNSFNPVRTRIYFKGNSNSSLENKSQSSQTKLSQERVKTGIFYVNDIHGNIGNMSRIYSAKNHLTKAGKLNGDVLVLASGDISAGADKNIVKATDVFLDSIKADGLALGNHEFDATPQDIADIYSGSRYDLLGLNVELTGEDNPLKGLLCKSSIKEINGHKYGIIGLTPPDLHNHIRDNMSKETVIPYSKEETVKSLQEEVDKLQSAGINKIIVLSHCGLNVDKEIAKDTEGIDVILGGHTHDLLESVRQDSNLLMSKSNEPVVITQAGKDGEQFGILNLEFDDNGIIKKVQNNVHKTKNYRRNLILEHVFDEIIGGKTQIGTIEKTVPEPKHRLIMPNPHGYIIADACREMLGTDVALINAGNIRGKFETGALTERKVFEVSPFRNNMVVLKLNEAELVNAVKVGAKSLTAGDRGNKPGIILPSGFDYKINDAGKLLSMNIIDKNGDKHPVDVYNPDKNKIYTVATDDFVASGSNGYMENKLSDLVEKFDFDKDKLTCDYIKQKQTGIIIKDDGRVKIV